MMDRHLLYHPTIPIAHVGKLPAADIYKRCIKEMYDLCHNHNLAYLWAYLWENWYRPARWILWARSSYSKLSRWRTTMAVESFWKDLKREVLHNRRVRVAGLVALLSLRVIPE